MIRVEFAKQFRRVRTYVGFGIVALIPIIFTVSFKLNPPKGRGREAGDVFFTFATQSGLNMPLAVLTAVSAFLLIVVVSLFAGETIAGEATWGTLRYLLVRPVRRGRLLASKLLVASVLAVIATIIVTVVALAAGVAAFGWNPVLTPGGVMSQGDAVARLALATVYTAWSMSAFVAFAFMLSSMTDSTFGAVAGGVGLGVVSQILNNISALDKISFTFPTHYLDSWQGLFFQPSQTTHMVHGVILQVPYLVVFLGMTWWWFGRKDVVS